MSKSSKSEDETKPKGPYMVFTANGYVWGAGHPDENKRGKKPYWDGALPTWARTDVAANATADDATFRRAMGSVLQHHERGLVALAEYDEGRGPLVAMVGPAGPK